MIYRTMQVQKAINLTRPRKRRSNASSARALSETTGYIGRMLFYFYSLTRAKFDH